MIDLTSNSLFLRVCIYSSDDSGHWGRGGLFTALSSRSLQPQERYERAGKMNDLSLGDAHIVSIDDLMSRESGKDLVGSNKKSRQHTYMSRLLYFCVH